MKFKTIICDLESLKMDKLRIERMYRDDCTLGILNYKYFKCFTLELPWKDNKRNISCIPDGSYKAKKHKSPSNGDCIAIENVLNRTYIQIHSANFTYQIKGCVAVGDSVKFLDNDGVPDVVNSKNTLKALLAVLPDSFQVEIL